MTNTAPIAASVPVLCSLVLGCAASAQHPGDPVGAQPSRTAPAISEQDLRVRVGLIADDSMQGRFTGSRGHFLFTEYLGRELARLGLTPGGEQGGYFQVVPFVRRHVARQRLAAAGVPIEPGRDFVPFHPGGRVRGFDGATVVFGGTLQDTSRQITREQAAGRFVILIHENPTEQAGNIRTAHRGHRLATAAAIATVNAPRALAGWQARADDPPPEYVGEEDADEPRPAAFAISAGVAERLLGRPLNAAVPVGTTGTTVQGEVVFRTESLTVRNVIAVLRGADPVRAADYVALGAHSDHVPFRTPAADHDSLRTFNAAALATQRASGRPYLTRAERGAIRVNLDSLRAILPARLDSIHNGADDDASGSATLLEVAEALAAGRRPARSVLFVWHAAEELGLIGSGYFTRNPTVDRNAIVAYLNIDMVGRGGVGDTPGGGPRYLQAIGWRRLSTELGDQIEDMNQTQELPFVWDLQYDAPGHPEQFYCRSDHYSYARYGIPIAFLSTGSHADYHEVTDEPQYLDYPKLARVGRLVRDVVTLLANRERRPVVDGPRPDPRESCRQ